MKLKVMSYMSQWRSLAKEALDRTAITAKFLCWLHFTDNYLCSPTHVYGPSMLPTLNLAGDVVLAEHVSQRLGKVGHGDLVLVRSPSDPNRCLTKRIVAMEGDTVTYFDPMRDDATQIAVVPKGHVWIQGDNIYASHDSRNFGPVPYGLIQGKVFFRIGYNLTSSVRILDKAYGLSSIRRCKVYLDGVSLIAMKVAACKVKCN